MTFQEIKDLNSKIEEIRLAFATEQATRQKSVRARYQEKFATDPKDEFETQGEYLSRVTASKEKAAREMNQELGRIKSKMQDELNVQLSPFVETMNRLENNEFVWTLNDLTLKIHKYNPESNNFPITIQSKQSGKGFMDQLLYHHSYLPLSRKEAKLFKQHYINKLLRPEIIFKSSGGHFQIDQAFVIDDAIGKKYRLKSSHGGMVLISSGCFQMGSVKDYSFFPKGNMNESPVHEICVDGFSMDKYEVTQGEYELAMGSNPSNLKGANLPVENVSWSDADKYCRKMGRRLPTEAEWEKAAKGGRNTVYPWGDEFDGSKVNFCDAKCQFDWKGQDFNDGHATTARVGSYAPNGYGLYDMAGNVDEWVADWYDNNYYRTAPRNNPQGPSSGTVKILRGGSWVNIPSAVRSAYRGRSDPTGRLNFIGFRCAQ